MEKGYIFTYRELMNKPIFEDPWLLKIWLWCLFKASYVPQKFLKGNTVIELERGQFIFGREEAANELSSSSHKISPSSFYRKMKLLEKLGSISLNVNSHGTLATIVNYDIYQPSGENGEQNLNSNGTEVEHIEKNKKYKKYIPPIIPLKKGGRKKRNDIGAYNLELFEQMLNEKE